MGNEMGNNNTSEIREEEKARVEGPEKYLLEGGGYEVEADEVAGFRQKEVRPSSDDAERVNGEHHVTAKEEEKNKARNTTDFQVGSEKLHGRTKEGNEVQVKCKEDAVMEFDLEESRSDGNENQHKMQAINQKDEDGKRDSNFNTTILALDEQKLEKTTEFKSNQHELLDIIAESLVEDSNRSSEECKDTLELSLNNTYNSADYAMEDSEETSNVDQVIDTGRDTNRENDGDKGKVPIFNMITHASEDPKSEKTSDFTDFDRETDKEHDGERRKGSNFNTITHASKDPKSEMTSEFDIDQVIDTDLDACKKNDGERRINSNFDTINASEDPKSKKTSNLDTGRATCKNNDEDKENGSNFDTLTHASKDTNSENSSDLKSIQHESPETKAESLAGSSDDGSSEESKYGFGFGLKRTEDNGHVMHKEKLTDADSTGSEPDTDVETKKGDLIEPRPCHEYTMPAAKKVDTKEKEPATDLIPHNSSCLPPEESLVVESPKSSMQVPEDEDRFADLKEESQLREEYLGTETVVEDNIPTQSKISNGIQEDFNTIGSHSKNNGEEFEVSPGFVAKNKNQSEAPGEDCEDSDEEYLEISEQGMDILNLSIGDYKHKNEEMGKTTEISTNGGHEAERREPDESLFEPVLWFKPQVHQKETSITFQTAESTDEPTSAPREETDTATEKFKNNPSDSPSYIQTASATFTETKPSTNPIDEQSLITVPLSTFGGENQESPRRTSNESNSDNSIGHVEMRKSPSFNIDIQSDGKAGEREKIPSLYPNKAIEDSTNLQEISLPNPMEKQVGKLGRSDSEKLRPSFPVFAKEKGESEMEFKAMDQNNLAADKKEAKDLPPSLPIRKGKRRTKSLIFGTCICCATAIN